ncbi:M48 family metallopeptidase [Rhizobium sp. KVB221]|uniref:M48 family metallopeptidase n=1 Tax=Rhizobium setariae TaxID=2801340 RepID=A0A936YP98_9HYPH|nr:SprT family zinc-dependent metalloprotease [Rhizobium setariae]MBL0374170.1 M48 family metallopeptidase [Rhizobium setariae]
MLSRLTFLQKPQRPSDPSTRTIDVAGRPISLTIKPDSRARRMTLRIEPGGKALKMTVPLGLRQREIDDFLARHEGWLMTRLARFPRNAGLEEGRYVQLRGVAHRIERTGKARGLTEAIVIDGESVLRVGGSEEHLGRRLRDYLKAEARKDLEYSARTHAATIGRRINAITLKDTKSRWGSCSHDGNLSFSWRIIMAPPYVIDYLAAHEVSHLEQMNHSDAFWTLCERLCPKTLEAKHWLKRNGAMLHVHDFG